MAWLKKWWDKIVSVFVVLTASGIVILNNGQQVKITSAQGVHLLTPDFGTVYANSAKPIDLKAGQRYIQVGMVLAGDSVIVAFADTLDTPVDISIIGKFTQCKK